MKYQYIVILLIVLDNCIVINNLTRPLLADSPTISLSPLSCLIYKLKPEPKYFCATYFSNGKTLNGTILLPPHANVGEGFRYGMIIRMNGGAYSSYIQQEPNGSSTRHVVQYIGNDDIANKSRILYGLQSALNGSYNKTNGFVDLSMNLADIGYPDQYFISFYIVNGSQTAAETLMRTERLEIPTLCHLECVLVQIPPSVTVFPSQPYVPVIIKAGNASKYLNLMKSTFHETYNLILKYKLPSQSRFLSSEPMAIPVIGEKPYKLSLSVSNNTPSGPISLFEYSTSPRNEKLLLELVV